jgi:hypothetical protein
MGKPSVNEDKLSKIKALAPSELEALVKEQQKLISKQADVISDDKDFKKVSGEIATIVEAIQEIEKEFSPRLEHLTKMLKGKQLELNVIQTRLTKVVPNKKIMTKK